MTQLWQLSAVDMAARLARGEVSSRELVQAHLDRIAAVDGKVRAFTAVFHDRALADADRADDERRRGMPCGALHGLPVSIKECFDFEGQATTLGIPSWRAKVASADAVMVTLFRTLGAVILGRTNISQTMLFVESRNPLFGETANPFSLAHTPGGSSGGEAAAIAAGMSPLGIGTDIGGSVRTPCHFSGIAGLKPSLDRLPMRGYRTVLAGQEAVRGQSGPLARTTVDVTFLMRALDGKAMSALDPRVPPLAWEEPSDLDVPKLRVGVYQDDGVVSPSHAVARAVDRAGEVLRARGCQVVAFTPPRVPELVEDYLAALSADGGSTLLEAMGRGEVDAVLKPLRRVATLPSSVRRGLARAMSFAGEKRTAGMLNAMGEKSVADLWRLTDRLRAYRFRVLDAMDAAKVDVIVCPVYATAALPHGLSKNFTLASSYSMVWNAVQFPAGVVPVTRVLEHETKRRAAKDSLDKQAAKVDKASVGLPIGVQVVARPWREATVLAVMQAVEDGVRGDADFPHTPVVTV
jgi:fatty acid amide hydrolase